MASTREDTSIESKAEAFASPTPCFSRNNTESETLYQKFIGHTLIGVFDIHRREIALMPCIKERVSLITRDNVITSGNLLGKTSDGLEKIRALTPKELEECKHSSYAPRFLVPDDDMENMISAHQYLVGFLEAEYNTFRGFSVIPEIEFPIIEWKSNGLNNKKNMDDYSTIEQINKIEDKSQMHPAYQTCVKRLIKNWSRPTDPIQCLLIDTFENAKDKMVALLESLIADINNPKHEKPFSTLQLSLIAYYCILMNRTDLAKKIAMTHDLDLNIYHPRDKNYPIHLLVAEEKPDIDFIHFVCEKAKNTVNLGNENYKKETALTIAIQHNHIEIAAYFIDTPSLFKQFSPTQIGCVIVEQLKKKVYDLANKLLDQQAENYVLAIKQIMQSAAQEESDLDCIRYLCEHGKEKLTIADEKSHGTDLWTLANHKPQILNCFIENPTMIRQVSKKALGESLFALLCSKEYEIAYALLKARPDAEVSKSVANMISYLIIDYKKPPHMKLIQALYEEMDTPISLTFELVARTALDRAIDYTHWELVNYFINKPALLNQITMEQLNRAFVALIKATHSITFDLIALKPGALKQHGDYFDIFSKLQATDEARNFKYRLVETLNQHSTSAQEVLSIIQELLKQEKQSPFLKNNTRAIAASSALFAPATDELLFQLVQSAKNKMMEYETDDDIVTFLNTPMSYKEAVTGCKHLKESKDYVATYYFNAH